MTVSKYTPGPWYWVKARTQQHLSCTGGGSFASVSMPIIGAKGYKGMSQEMKDKYEANANLIASAPELLEALEDFERIAAIAKPNCGPKLREMIQRAQEKHTGLISKVKGGV